MKMYRVILETGPVQDPNDGSIGFDRELLYIGHDLYTARLEYERSKIADNDEISKGWLRETKLQARKDR